MTANKQKSNRGGKREGAGRKAAGPQGEKKCKFLIRLYPTQRAAIIAKYGSLQRAVDGLDLTPNEP